MSRGGTRSLDARHRGCNLAHLSWSFIRFKPHVELTRAETCQRSEQPSLCSPKEDSGRGNKRRNRIFGALFKGVSTQLWATNHGKVLRKSDFVFGSAFSTFRLASIVASKMSRFQPSVEVCMKNSRRETHMSVSSNTDKDRLLPIAIARVAIAIARFGHLRCVRRMIIFLRDADERAKRHEQNM
jgi:hypothetical protein